jgi:hypothetical protein
MEPVLMNVPLFQRGELLRISRIIGSLLSFVTGLVLIAQTFIIDLVPPPAGYAEAQAVVAAKYQRGTFIEPAFSVTLEYQILHKNGDHQQIRSGLRVDFEEYFRITVGETLRIHYDTNNPYTWQIIRQKSGPRDYALGILMGLIGLLSLLFPMIISLASRQKDFEFSEQIEAQ